MGNGDAETDQESSCQKHAIICADSLEDNSQDPGLL